MFTFQLPAATFINPHIHPQSFDTYCENMSDVNIQCVSPAARCHFAMNVLLTRLLFQGASPEAAQRVHVSVGQSVD